MCRLAAFPPNFPREEALDILQDMESMNRDGLGSAYVDKNSFQILRQPQSLTHLLHAENKGDFLAHMPYNGWTICHMRMATHGENTVQNTHPFVAGKWCVMHNGVWSAYRSVYSLIRKQVTLKGETDSEVAAHMINLVGPKDFTENVLAGVFLALNRDGNLWVCKTSGTLHCAKTKWGALITTDDSQEDDSLAMADGWYHYTPKGRLKALGSGAKFTKPFLASMKGWRGYQGDWRRDYGQDTATDGLDRPDRKESHRFGCTVYEFKKPPQEFGPDGFPIKPHCTGGKSIIVPRDPGVIDSNDDLDDLDDCGCPTYDDRGMPRYPGHNCVVTQTKLP